jgi:hypothetical protein
MNTCFLKIIVNYFHILQIINNLIASVYKQFIIYGIV